MPSLTRDHRLAYGLHIESEFALPELPFLPDSYGECAPDVRIEVGPSLSRDYVQSLTLPDAPFEDIMSFEDNSSRVIFSEVARVKVENGSHIVVEPIEGTTSAAWRLPVLGSMLALLLEQRDLFSLHAGAAQMPGPDGPIACAFAGEKGQGKSTLNAALSLSGYPLLCDDVLAIRIAPETPTLTALSGFSGVKLLPDAVSAVVNRSPDELEAVAPELAEVAAFHKRHFAAELAPEPLPLRHVFLLASHDEPERNDIELRSLDPQNALALLLPHTFGVRWGDLYLTGQRSARHLRACAKIVTSCRVWELSRRRDLALLPKTIELIARTVRETV